MSPPPTLYRAIVCVDIEGFSARPTKVQSAMRTAMYEALRQAFEASDIPHDHREDRGDGAFFLIPADGAQDHLVEPLPFELSARLARHNRAVDADDRIRLRVSLHAGHVHNDGKGIVGDALNNAFRLLNSDVLRAELRETAEDAAFIAPEEFHREIIRDRREPGTSVDRRVRVQEKETDADAWLCAFATQRRAGREYGGRLAAIEEELDGIEKTLAVARRRRAETVRLIASPVPEVPDPIPGLRIRLDGLDGLRRHRAWDRLIIEAAAVEREARAAHREARGAQDAVAAPLDVRDELRGRLDSYLVMARTQDRAEDPSLVELYERARGLLRTLPCDLLEAEAATMRYVAAVQKGREGDAR